MVRRDDNEPRRSQWRGPTTRIELVLAIISALAAAAGLGWRVSTPLSDRVTKLEQREDLDSYILCMMVRRVDPISVPPECAPIEEAHILSGRHGMPRSSTNPP